ncbi:hypothetical protein F383_26876 [Gossypium arboreum]|uniref:Uncharacterized protein n=1 Tax=Gossypium arboreum TaxID=29729 RepID=A0A0B0MQW7_GOSAR|nr:hypothetical protein F383_26876 [Gossypium arboreum]
MPPVELFVSFSFQMQQLFSAFTY